MSLYMTGKNVDDKRLEDILNTIEGATNRWGFVKDMDTPEAAAFKGYMDKIVKYGIAHEHETILDFIKVTIFMEDLHRGALDDYDAHAKRLDIIRSSTRANKKFSGKDALISDWYQGKILTFQELDKIGNGPEFADTIEHDGYNWTKTPWGYVREDYANDADVLRGLVPLSLACDNVSTVSYRNLRHIYHLRRRGTHASPELQDAVEQIREELNAKCPILGHYLGKVWVPGANGYFERPDTVITLKEEGKECQK